MDLADHVYHAGRKLFLDIGAYSTTVPSRDQVNGAVAGPGHRLVSGGDHVSYAIACSTASSRNTVVTHTMIAAGILGLW